MSSVAPFDQHRTYFEMRLDRSLPAHEKIPVLCPFHDDHSPSATVFLENGWLYCNGCGFSGGVIDCEMRFSNCDEETAKKNIAEITGVSLNGGGWRFISEHIYRDREGVPVSRKRRYDLPNGKKECPWDHRDSKGRWQTGLLKGTPRPLYNLPETITANLLLYSEGEKCADWLTAQIPNLWPERQAKGLRIAATTSPDGAWEPTAKKPKWRDEYNKYFGGKSLVIFEDNDPNGRTACASSSSTATIHAMLSETDCAASGQATSQSGMAISKSSVGRSARRSPSRTSGRIFLTRITTWSLWILWTPWPKASGNRTAASPPALWCLCWTSVTARMVPLS